MGRAASLLGGGAALRTGGAAALFFALKLVLGLVLLGASTEFLSVAEFVAFSQLFLLFALLASMSAAGVQNGLTRQVALAAGDAVAERRAIAAAVRIWALASLVALIAATALGRPISELLVGNASLARFVPVVMVLAIGGGFGILACAILNGRHRAALSLSLQSIGLVLGGVLCLWRLIEGDAAGAVLGYAAGPLATSLAAWLALRRSGVRLRPIPADAGGEVRLLLGYALVFLAIAALMPVTLFALRHVYREAFGTELLGYWLAANRVSDVTSQILGLYMAQIFLPQATRETAPEPTRRLVLRTFLLGSAVMLAGWAVFAIGAPFFVTTFLSTAYLPAIPFISGYLLGDGLRVAASLTAHLMLARGRLWAAVGVEASTALLLTAYLVGFARAGWPEAPYWAYPAAYGTLAVVLALWFFLWWRRLGAEVAGRRRDADG